MEMLVSAGQFMSSVQFCNGVEKDGFTSLRKICLN